jgi:hypothetical protein
MSNSPAPPIDRHKLKQAADKLAELLNDFQTGGLALTSAYGDGWRVIPGTGWDDRRYALVDNPHGYWDTTQVNGPDPESEPSLADRLRVLAAEVEALTAQPEPAVARCESEFATPASGRVRCRLVVGHADVHLAPGPEANGPEWYWHSMSGVIR